jgi:hypothetical protein
LIPAWCVQIASFAVEVNLFSSAPPRAPLRCRLAAVALQRTRLTPLPLALPLAPLLCLNVLNRIDFSDVAAIPADDPLPRHFAFKRPHWLLMSPSDENKLIALLTEIHCDVRQIKSDLQSIITLLKQQQQKPTSASFSESADTASAIESVQSGTPEDVLRYLRETRGEDDNGE